MAYFSGRSGKVRAHVCIDGTRLSKTFASLGEAEAWASLQEQRIRARREARELMRNHSLGAAVPRRVLHARSLLPMPEAMLVAAAIPASLLSGVYFLIQKAEVVYVGQSVDVFGRLSRHLKSGRFPFDSFNVIPCEPERMDALEAAYITALMPIHNRDLGETQVTPDARQFWTNADAAALG